MHIRPIDYLENNAFFLNASNKHDDIFKKKKKKSMSTDYQEINGLEISRCMLVKRIAYDI